MQDQDDNIVTLYSKEIQTNLEVSAKGLKYKLYMTPKLNHRNIVRDTEHVDSEYVQRTSIGGGQSLPLLRRTLCFTKKDLNWCPKASTRAFFNKRLAEDCKFKKNEPSSAGGNYSQRIAFDAPDIKLNSYKRQARSTVRGRNHYLENMSDNKKSVVEHIFQKQAKRLSFKFEVREAATAQTASTNSQVSNYANEKIMQALKLICNRKCSLGGKLKLLYNDIIQTNLRSVNASPKLLDHIAALKSSTHEDCATLKPKENKERPDKLELLPEKNPTFLLTALNPISYSNQANKHPLNKLKEKLRRFRVATHRVLPRSVCISIPKVPLRKPESPHRLEMNTTRADNKKDGDCSSSWTTHYIKGFV